MLSRLGHLLTLIAWTAMIIEAVTTPTQFHLNAGWSRIVMVIAAVGTISILRAVQRRPVEDVFDAGREYQRRLDMKEYSPRRRHSDKDKVVGLRG